MATEVGGVLEVSDEPIGLLELEEAGPRAGRRGRGRGRGVAWASALLAVGALGGALLRGPVVDRSGGAGAAPRSPSQASNLPPPLPDDVSGLRYLFRREANGVAIRAYRRGTNLPPPPPPFCGAVAFIQAELSNGAAITSAGSPDVPGDGLGVLGTGTFGQEEGQPATWAIVRAGAGIASVRLRTASATDTMAPQGGFAVLAVPGPGAGGFVDGLDGTGTVVVTRSVTEISNLPPGPVCFPANQCVTPGDPNPRIPTARAGSFVCGSRVPDVNTIPPPPGVANPPIVFEPNPHPATTARK